MSFALFPYLQIIGTLFFYLQYSLIVKEEEKVPGSAVFGKDYDEYVKNVPRFLPRLSPYRSGSVVQPPLQSAGRDFVLREEAYRRYLLFLLTDISPYGL
jgi:hypothetical protein